MKRIILTILVISLSITLWADSFVFNPDTKYRIECLYVLPSSIALGSNHSINSPLCVTPTNYTSEDCYWYIKEESEGKYSLRNASTGQYITRDDQHVNTPVYLRYVHMSSNLEGDESLWTIGTKNDATYGTIYYFQSVGNPSYVFHMRTGSNMYMLGGYASSPDSYTFLFRFYNAEGTSYTPPLHSDVNPEPEPEPVVDDPEPVIIDSSKVLQPIVDSILFVYRADGKVDAIPYEYVTSQEQDDQYITIHTIADTVYTYKNYEVDSLSNVSPELPVFNSFKFNNKFNHHIISDANGTFYGDSLITCYVVGIGKTLTPSFKLNDDVGAYIYDIPQISKESHARFANDVTYTVARYGQSILRRNLNGEYVVRPYGRDVKVRVDFATDHPTSPYRVPTVYITTNNGTMITSKNYWWAGKVRIDGGGVFPDMEETPIQIKGRGNSSWTSTGKAPYHMKFETALKPFGLTKGKHWNLLANALTHSMECNAIAMKAAQLVETAGFNHMIPVELYVNGRYRGSYNFTEKIGFANNSIDLSDETYCAMYELDTYYDADYKFNSDAYGLPVNIKEPDFSDTENPTPLTVAQVKNAFNRSMSSLLNGNEPEYQFDLDYLAKFLFVDELTCNYELFHPKSTFCYAQNILDSSSPLVFGPVWDYDWCFGGPSTYFTRNNIANYWEKTDGAGRVWAKAMRYNIGAPFDKKYYQLWTDFNKNHLDELIDFVDDYYNFVKLSYTHDNTIWSKGDADTYYQLKEQAKAWLKQRAEHCLDYMTNTLGYGDLNYKVTETEHPTIGDVNEDGRITAADLVCALNFLLGLPNEDFSFRQCDTDHNDIITIADLQKIRSLNKSIRTKGYFGLPEADAAISTGPVSYSTENITVPLVINISEGNYSGLQFDINIPKGMTIEDLNISKTIPDFNLHIEDLESEGITADTYDTYRIVLYAPGNCLMPEGQTTIDLLLDWGTHIKTSGILAANISNVMFVSSLAQDLRSNATSAQFIADQPTGIESVVSFAQNDGKQLTFHSNGTSVVPIYTTDGRIYRMYEFQSGSHNVNLPAGIYIINKQKVIIK